MEAATLSEGHENVQIENSTNAFEPPDVDCCEVHQQRLIVMNDMLCNYQGPSPPELVDVNGEASRPSCLMEPHTIGTASVVPSGYVNLFINPQFIYPLNVSHINTQQIFHTSGNIPNDFFLKTEQSEVCSQQPGTRTLFLQKWSLDGQVIPLSN